MVADRDTEGLYVSSDLWIMIISRQRGRGGVGGETVSAQENIVSEVTLFLVVTYLLRPFMSED